MRIAVTGGSGFVGSHLVKALAAAGHQAVCIARGAKPVPIEGAEVLRASVTDLPKLREAFSGCEVVVHLAGINRDVGDQTFERVHVEGTRHVMEAAKAVGARKLVLLSFLKAGPNAGSRYHETKWQAEQIVRGGGLSYSILKAGVIFGPGDGMVTNIWRTLRLAPFFAKVGFKEATVRPVWVGDVVSILAASAVGDRLTDKVVPVLGPTELPLSEAVKRVAQAINRRVFVVPLPVRLHYALAGLGERLMRQPIVSVSQIRMLAEGASDPLPGCDALPSELEPETPFDAERILESIAFAIRR
jgi:NADH dehydrogenase